MPSIDIVRSIHNCLIFGLDIESDIDNSLLDYLKRRQFRDNYQLFYPKWRQIREELLIGCLVGRPVTIITTYPMELDRLPNERVVEYDLTWPFRPSLLFSLFHGVHAVSIVQIDQCSEETALQVIRCPGFDISMVSISSSIPFADRKIVEKVFAHMQDSNTSSSLGPELVYELISCYDDGLVLEWSNPQCGVEELKRIIRNITTTRTDWDFKD